MNKEEVIKQFREKFTTVSKDSEDRWLKSSNGQVFVDPYLEAEIELWLESLGS